MKIGVLGTGNIANVVTRTLAQMEEIECYAVASRSLEKADKFAQQYGFKKAYGSYEQLLEDEEVQLVYVATPHSQHFECMMNCLEHSKPVLGEKAFTLNSSQARKVKEYAEAHKVFAAEAIWTRYMPSRAIIQKVVDSGIVGKINALTANLCYNSSHNERVVNPNLAGGALLDVGVYGLNFALMHFGNEIDRIEASAVFSDTGVDALDSITLLYKDGRMAVITAGIYSRSDRQGVFYGEKGYIVVENINNPQSVSVYDTADQLIERIQIPEQISGYEHEFLECARALREGRTESWSMPLAESVYVMEIIDSIRCQWHLVYPQEAD